MIPNTETIALEDASPVPLREAGKPRLLSPSPK